MEGWIKSYRKKLDWEWFTDVPTAHLFDYLLHAAEYEPRKWQGHSVEAGELITTIGSLAERTGLSTQQVRTALNKLQSTGEIVLTSTNKYTLVKVQNYGIYQGYELPEQQTNNKQGNKQITNEQQTNNKRHTIIKEIKNTKIQELKNITSETPAREAIWEYAPDVLMTDEQACKLIDWCSPEELEQYVVNLQEYIENGHTVHNCYETICRWKERDSTTRRSRNASTV